MASTTPTKSSHRRKLEFALAGALGAASSYLVLWITVDLLGINPTVAYLLQTVISVEVNFLANHLITWRDRNTGFGTRWVRFHTTRVLLVLPANQLLFALFHPFTGVMIANTLVLGISTFANWFINDKWAFTNRLPRSVRKAAKAAEEVPAPSAAVYIDIP